MTQRIKPTYLRSHKVVDHDQLLVEWQDLFPEFHPDPSRRGLSRRFHDREIDAQGAGWVFQHWVCEAFRLCGVRVDDAYTVPLESSERIKEEIDGLVTTEWQGFVIQCKLERDPIPFDPIARLHLQVERRPIGTLGLFFADDYSEAAIELAADLRPIRVILFRTNEINQALTGPGRLDMLKLVQRKWREVVKYGKLDWPLEDIPEGDRSVR